jgi:hypothetical protein
MDIFNGQAEGGYRQASRDSNENGENQKEVVFFQGKLSKRLSKRNRLCFVRRSHDRIKSYSDIGPVRDA